MTIQINFDGIITTEELSDLLESQYPVQASQSVSDLTKDYSNMIGSGGQNCSIMSSVNALLSSAVADIRQSVKAATAELESVIGEMTKKIGEITKELRIAIQKSVDEVMKLVDWLRTQTSEVLQAAKDAVQSVIDSVNENLIIAQQAIQEVIDYCRDIALELSNSLSNLYIRTCNSMSEAIKNVGYGAGIDDKVNVVNSSLEEANEVATGKTVEVIAISYQNLTQTSSGLPTGGQARFNVETSFASIDDLIGLGS